MRMHGFNADALLYNAIGRYYMAQANFVALRLDHGYIRLDR